MPRAHFSSVLLLAGIASLAACEGPPGPAGETMKLAVDDDTYVAFGEEAPPNPHVTADSLLVSPGEGSGASRAFMKWELIGFSDVAAAHLHFEAKISGGAEPHVLGIHGSDDDGWDGDEMTWSGQPDPIFLLGTALVPASNETLFYLDVTAYVMEQLLRGPIPNENKTELTIAFAMVGTGGSVAVSSSEEPDHAPRLLVLPL